MVKNLKHFSSVMKPFSLTIPKLCLERTLCQDKAVLHMSDFGVEGREHNSCIGKSKVTFIRALLLTLLKKIIIFQLTVDMRYYISFRCRTY